MKNTDDSYKSLNDKIYSNKLGGGFFKNSRFKPSKLRELAEIGGECTHVCVEGSMMVIYNSRHVSLEMFTYMENIVITPSSSCNMHAMYLPQSPTNNIGKQKCISFTTWPFGILMLFPIACFKASNDILLSSWTIFDEPLKNVEPCLVVMMTPS